MGELPEEGAMGLSGEQNGTLSYMGKFFRMGGLLHTDLPFSQFPHLHDFPSSGPEIEGEGQGEQAFAGGRRAFPDKHGFSEAFLEAGRKPCAPTLPYRKLRVHG